MKSAICVTFVVVAAMIACGEAALKCPELPTIADLDMNRYLGSWYSIQESSPPRLPCLNYDVKLDDKGNFALTFLPFNVRVTNERIDSNDITKGFKLVSKSEILTNAHVSIFTTDYDNYAGIFTCKEYPDKTFFSVTLWSRTRTLSLEAVAKMKAVLDKYQVDHSKLDLIEQGDLVCHPKVVPIPPKM